MHPSRIKFSRALGVLAVIEGSVRRDSERLEFELAMTESVTGPVKSVIKRQVDLSDLESIRVKRRIFRKSRLEFTARSLAAFENLPGASGFTFSVWVENFHKDTVSFVRDVQFEMTRIEMDALSKRISANAHTLSTAGDSSSLSVAMNEES